VIFPNREKKGNTYPDFKGEVDIDGQIYFVSLWNKETINGTPFWAGTVLKKPTGMAMREDGFYHKHPSDDPF